MSNYNEHNKLYQLEYLDWYLSKQGSDTCPECGQRKSFVRCENGKPVLVCSSMDCKESQKERS